MQKEKGLDISVLRDEDAELTAWFPFMNGAEVELCYIPADELDKLIESCKVRKYKKHQAVFEVDTELLFKKMGQRAIKNWKGFKDKGRALPCTDDNREFMMRRLSGFGQFIQESATEFTGFIRERLEDEGNLSGPTSGPGEISQE